MTAETSPSSKAPPSLPSSVRARLTDTRTSLTAKNSCGSFEFYVTVGFYDDDPARPGEVFIVISKEGSVLSGCMDALARTISLALQYGVPWKDIAAKYRHMRFEPCGPSQRWPTHNYGSIVDAVADTVEHLVQTMANYHISIPFSENPNDHPQHSSA